MSIWLDKSLLRRLIGAEKKPAHTPIPTQVVSNGEYVPAPQSPQQKAVEEEIERFADHQGRRLGMSRRAFLRSSCGIVAGLAAMNKVYGGLFVVDEAEASDPEAAEAARQALEHQFIFDVQLHFVHDDYSYEGLLGLREYARRWNPKLEREKITFDKLKFDNFVKEVYLDSQTDLGLLSGAPSDNPDYWFLSNQQIAEARAVVNAVAGSKRLLCHSVIVPGAEGWLDDIDRAISELRPDSWKGYTIGDPLQPSERPWRLDDEALVYPMYEKMVKAGINKVCIHKGLLPADYEEAFPDQWRHAKVDDVGKAARDWPELDFIIYHSAIKPLAELPETHLARFERTGRIDWVTDLAEIPERYGVDNVYAELGTCFASSAVTHPRHCAGLLGTLIKGMGADHVLWGTDSVWYGSPQWQIEAFRRLEIPEDLQDRFGFEPLGPADSATRNAILGLNAARLYGIELDAATGKVPGTEDDYFARLRRDYDREGRVPSNTAYGFIDPQSIA